MVHGIVFSHYPVADRSAEAYATVMLFESGYADQIDIAQCFGYSTRTLRRYQERLKGGGLSTLARPEGRPAAVPPLHIPERDRTILRRKAKAMSNRRIAGRLGLSKTAVRKSLCRHGWKRSLQPCLPGLGNVSPEAEPATVSDNPSIKTRPPAAEPPSRGTEQPQSNSVAKSLDADPLDRSRDRPLATMGLLEDAPPLFAATQNLPRAGVLLAVPALVASGVLATAEKVYGSLDPVFYGLRTTLAAYVLLALLTIPRPETLKEYPPGELDRILRLESERTISEDWVVRYPNRFSQLQAQSRHYAPAQCKVLVCEGRHGSIAIEYRGRALRWQEIPAPARPTIQTRTKIKTKRGHFYTDAHN